MLNLGQWFGLRRLYEWVLSWGHSRHARKMLFLLAFTEAIFFPIPPDILLLTLGLAIPRRAVRMALLTTAGSVAGGLLGYAVGVWCWPLVDDFFYHYVPGFSPAGFAQLQQLFQRYDFWVVFLAGFTPLPYKIFTIGAGVFQIPLGIFLLASLISRGLRFLLIGLFIYRFGEQTRDFTLRYFNKLTFAAGLVLVAGLCVAQLWR